MKEDRQLSPRRVALLLLLLATPLLAFVCGGQYNRAPVVQNTLDKTILLSIKYGNGDSVSAEFAPGARGFSPVEGIEINEISVRVDGQTLFKVQKSELRRMRSNLPPGIRIVWEIHGSGVTPKEYSEKTPRSFAN